MDNAPSIPQMKREIQDARVELETRTPPATSDDLVDMLDSKLTNFISDLKKTDPQYEKKIRYFKGLLSSGMLPNATETFERKGHRTGGRKTRRRSRRYHRKTLKAGAGPADSELFRAIQSQSADGVKAALSRGADPNAVKPDDANTPLIEAVHKDNPELVQILINAGASVDAKGSEGGTALYWAADNMPLNDVKSPIAVKINTIIKILLKAGANPQVVYDTLAKYPEALADTKAKIERVRNPQMAVEVGVKKELPPFLPAMLKGYLGSAKRHRTRKH